MIVRGGGRGKAGSRKCDCLRIADDQSLLLKNPAMVCPSYKMELLKGVTGGILSRCLWANVDGNSIYCLKAD